MQIQQLPVKVSKFNELKCVFQWQQEMHLQTVKILLQQSNSFSEHLRETKINHCDWFTQQKPTVVIILQVDCTTGNTQNAHLARMHILSNRLQFHDSHVTPSHALNFILFYFTLLHCICICIPMRIEMRPAIY